MKKVVKGKLSQSQQKFIIEFLVKNMMKYKVDLKHTKEKLEDFVGYNVFGENDPEQYYSYLLSDRVLKEAKGIRAYNLLVAGIYIGLDGRDIEWTYNHEGKHYRYGSDKLRFIYDFITEFGFEISEIEQQLLDGTHEDYRK